MELHPETREALKLVAFVVCGFILGIVGLALIVVFGMKYD